MRRTWRQQANIAIRAAMDTGKSQGLEGAELEAYVRANGYPFGERRYHPYRVWCDEVYRVLGIRKPSRRPEDGDLKFAMGDGIDGMEEDDEPNETPGFVFVEPDVSGGPDVSNELISAEPDPLPPVPDLPRDRPNPKRKGRKPSVPEPACPDCELVRVVRAEEKT